MVVSVVLLPNSEDSSLLIDQSKKINELKPSLIQLGDGNLPHITVAQFIAPAEAISKLWEEVEPLKKTVSELNSGGLCIVPSVTHNQLWVELQFLTSQALADLQTVVLQSRFATSHRLHSGARDSYRPHCTLALYEGEGPMLPSFELTNSRIFKRTFQDLQLVVGHNGDNFTFNSIKFS